MRLLIGLILLFIGAALIMAGIVMGLLPLIHLYQGALTDAINQPANIEQDTSRAMFRGIIIGALGVLPFLIGSALVKVSIFQKLRKNKQR